MRRIRCLFRGHRWLRYGQISVSWPDGTTTYGPRATTECMSCGKVIEFA